MVVFKLVDGITLPDWLGSLSSLFGDKFITPVSDISRCDSIEDLDEEDPVVIALSESVSLYHSKVSKTSRHTVWNLVPAIYSIHASMQYTICTYAW